MMEGARVVGVQTRFESGVTHSTPPVEVDEVRVAVISPEVSRRYAGLEGIEGQVHRINESAWVIVLPRKAEQLPAVVEPLMLETRPVKIQVYAGPNDPALQRFEWVIQPSIEAGSFQIVSRQPLVAPDLDAFLRQIVANLAGLEEGAVSAEELEGVKEALGLGAHV